MSPSTSPRFFTYDGYGETLLDEMKYNQAVRVGDRIETAGQGGWDPKTGTVPTDVLEEIDQAFANVDLALRQAGGKGWSQVYRIRLYALPEAMDSPVALGRMVENIDRWTTALPGESGKAEAGGQGAEERSRKRRPILTGVGVARLGQPGMRVEVEVAAYDPQV